MRACIGIDHLTITPPDKYGRQAVLVVHVHHSKFTDLFVLDDYTALEVARALLTFFARYGIFTTIASDPGSAFMSSVVAQLNDWLGIRHKVSLVDRHESNGCERTIREIIRHLLTIVIDYRLERSWSPSECLQFIAFTLNSKPNREIGGLTPFEVMYLSLIPLSDPTRP